MNMLCIGDIVRTDTSDYIVGVLKKVENGQICNTYFIDTGMEIKQSNHVYLASKADILEYKLCQNIKLEI